MTAVIRHLAAVIQFSLMMVFRVFGIFQEVASEGVYLAMLLDVILKGTLKIGQGLDTIPLMTRPQDIQVSNR